MAATYNFTGESALCQGATWSWSILIKNYLTGVPWDLTGYTARMQLREYTASTGVLLELTTANNRLVISAPLTGIISASVDATTTAALTFTRAVYDLEIVSGATVTRLLQGVVDLDKEVTR